MLPVSPAEGTPSLRLFPDSSSSPILVHRLLSIILESSQAFEEQLIARNVEMSSTAEEGASQARSHVEVHVTFGRVLGKYVRKPISLPVESDVILQQSTEHDYVPELSHTSAETLFRVCSGLLQADRQQLQVMDRPPMIYREIHEPQSGCTWVRSGHAGKIGAAAGWCGWMRSSLGKITVYRPKSDLHYQLEGYRVATSDDALPPDGTAGLLTVDKRVHIWEFKRGNHDYARQPIWRLMLLEKRNPGSDCHDNVPLDWDEAPPASEDDPDDAKVTVEVRLLIDLLPFVTGRRRQKQARNPNDVQLGEREMTGIIHELLTQISAVANVLDVPHLSTGFFYPNLIGDVAAKARMHYDAKKIRVASQSSIEFTRKINNMIKRLLIDETCPQNAEVLDLACGHGQDMLKFTEKQIKILVGVDISQEEVEEARRRVGRGISRKGGLRNARFVFNVGNVLQDSTWSMVKKEQSGGFSLVTVQLAIHYMVPMQKQCDELLQRISEQLKAGGRFIGSLPDTDVIAERLAEPLLRKVSGPPNYISYSFGNQYYSVMFDNETMKKIRGKPDEIGEKRPPGTVDENVWLSFDSSQSNEMPQTDEEQNAFVSNNFTHIQNLLSTTWGLSYKFWLVDHIDLKEYIVPWRSFVERAEAYGLRLQISANFGSYIDEADRNEWPIWKEFLAKERYLNLNDDAQKDVVRFYKVFCFVKTGADPLPVAPRRAPANQPGDVNPLSWDRRPGAAISRQPTPLASPGETAGVTAGVPVGVQETISHMRSPPTGQGSYPSPSTSGCSTPDTMAVLPGLVDPSLWGGILPAGPAGPPAVVELAAIGVGSVADLGHPMGQVPSFARPAGGEYPGSTSNGGELEAGSHSLLDAAELVGQDVVDAESVSSTSSSSSSSSSSSED